MAAHKTWGPFNFLWKWLNSLPIAIYVMLLLALLIGALARQLEAQA